jgi:hypothetical protein
MSSLNMNLAYQTIESVCIEININNRLWVISGLFRPPSLSDSEFTKDYTKTFDKTTTKYENFLQYTPISLLNDIL